MATKTKQVVLTAGTRSSVAGGSIEPSHSYSGLEINELQVIFTTGGGDFAEANRAALALQHHQRLIDATADWQPTKDHDHPRLAPHPHD